MPDTSFIVPDLVILGPPGSGKGTQAKPLAEERGLTYVSTGQLLRDAGGEAKQYMERGELVPDELVVGLVRDAIGEAGYVLDGFPRNTGQAEALDAGVERLGRELPRAVLIDVPDTAHVERLSARRICEAEGHEYHVKFRPPEREGVCDVDGSKLIRRADDEPATIHNRLRVYQEQTEPLIAYYEQRDRLERVDGDAPGEEVARRLAAAVE
jgi:adenylate kinase